MPNWTINFTVDETVGVDCFVQVVQSMELVKSELHECQQVIVELILWIVEKAPLLEEDVVFLLDSLQLGLINKVCFRLELGFLRNSTLSSFLAPGNRRFLCTAVSQHFMAVACDSCGTVESPAA